MTFDCLLFFFFFFSSRRRHTRLQGDWSSDVCSSDLNSAVTKLAPPRIVGMMMGVWFLSIAAGNKLAGWVAGLSASVPLTTLFGALAGVTLGAAVVLFLLLHPVRRLRGGVHYGRRAPLEFSRPSAG